MAIGKNTGKYLHAALTKGPVGILETAVNLQDDRKAHARKKELKSTPRTTNINTSPGVTHVSYSTNHGDSNDQDSVNRNDWDYG